ncbi:MAG: class II fumarate hydratase [Halieaceae bacterium]|uniref:class II fumarate hydratase n=1 Tax=Haliea alexandrii TaxID=2448162 RepID=UPI000F0B7A38|nr:class II fumarate hydratase [Haliea alexandrii]MCR9186097.1 class II fumarate hydratase [Halieaceae bacterium]
MTTRTETDSLGDVQVPRSALYGAQTQRALNHAQIAPRRTMPLPFLHAMALLKSAAAQANAQVDALSPALAAAIVEAAEAVASGHHDDAFPVPVFQTGSGTSSNMNMNEVVASLASRALGERVHPNDHVNCSQSSNDVVPSATALAAAREIRARLLPALGQLEDVLCQRGNELEAVVKTGRTHLMDAMPVTLGFELRTWAAQLQDCRQRLTDLQPRLCALAIGGSAVGTGVNVPPGYVEALLQRLSERVGFSLTAAAMPSTRMAAQETAVECSAGLRSIALVLIKMGNDLRWMNSGPLAGLGELQLEALQPGSSIMPGKVNPVIPEAVLMAATEALGNDATVVLAAQSGNFQLNVMLPLIADKLLDSIALLAGSCASMTDCLAGLQPLADHAAATLARNPVLVTALNPEIGYEAAAAIAKRAVAEGRPVLDVAEEDTGMSRDALARLLDPGPLARGNHGE